MPTHNMSWSNPRRSDDERALPSIANELFLEIFEYIIPGPYFGTPQDCRRTFTSLSLTCRFFAAVSIPRLFREVIIAPASHADTFVWVRRVLNQDPSAVAIAEHVETVIFVGWGPTPPQDILETGIQVLAHIPRLKMLCFTHTNVTQAAVDAIGELKNLESIQLGSCHANGAIVPIPRSYTTYVSHSDGSLSEVVRKLSNPGTLRTLAFGHYDWTKQPPAFPNLTRLDIDRLRFGEEKGLFQFLDSTPSLTTIRMGWGEELIPTSSLSPTALPRLTRLKMPISMIPSLAIGRAIEALDLTSNRSWQPQYNVEGALAAHPHPSAVRLSALFAGLKELAIEPKLLPTTILLHVPGLEVLKIDLYPRQSIDEVASDLAQSTATPRTLDLQFRAEDFMVKVDLAKQHDIVLVLAQSMPSLSYVIIRGLVRWHLQDSPQHAGERSTRPKPDWIPCVIDRAAFLDETGPNMNPRFFGTGHGRLRPRDYEGCLARLFAAEISDKALTLVGPARTRRKHTPVHRLLRPRPAIG